MNEVQENRIQNKLAAEFLICLEVSLITSYVRFFFFFFTNFCVCLIFDTNFKDLIRGLNDS